MPDRDRPATTKRRPADATIMHAAGAVRWAAGHASLVMF